MSLNNANVKNNIKYKSKDSRLAACDSEIERLKTELNRLNTDN
jgi:uncharacterized small protein (DUF1192 family)